MGGWAQLGCAIVLERAAGFRLATGHDVTRDGKLPTWRHVFANRRRRWCAYSVCGALAASGAYSSVEETRPEQVRSRQVRVAQRRCSGSMHRGGLTGVASRATQENKWSGNDGAAELLHSVIYELLLSMGMGWSRVLLSDDYNVAARAPSYSIHEGHQLARGFSLLLLLLSGPCVAKRYWRYPSDPQSPTSLRKRKPCSAPAPVVFQDRASDDCSLTLSRLCVRVLFPTCIISSLLPKRDGDEY